MKSGISWILVWGCWFSERLFTVSSYHPSCRCHPTYQTLTVPLPTYHSNRIHYMWQQCHFSNPSNVHISPSITQTNTAKLSKSCQVFYQPGRKRQLNIAITNVCNLHFKYISECIFHRTQQMAVHNTVMTSNTNGVPPSETHMQCSFTQCRTTNCQPVQILG